MKNLLLSVIAVLMSSSTAPLKYTGPSVAKPTIIEGHVNNRKAYPESKSILIQIPDISGYTGTSYTGLINNDGNFKIYLNLYVAQDANLKQEGISMQPIIKDFIIHPGDKIHVDLDFKSIASVRFSGDSEKTNNDLYNYTTNYGDYRARYESGHLYDVHDPEQFKAANNKIKQEILKQNNEFINKAHPNTEVKTWIKNYINTNYYLNLSGFMFKYNRVPTNNPPLGMDYVNIARDDINEIYNATLLNADSYRLLALLMPAHKAEELLGKYDDKLVADINKVAKDYNNPLLGQLLTGMLLSSTLGQTDPADFYKNKALLEENITEGFIKDPLIKKYKLVTGNVAQYHKAVYSIAQKMVGTPAEKVMKDIISQNKGKVVYIDIWATWCGACIAEMPKSQQLIEKYKGKNVAFAFLCIGSKKDLWKTKAQELGVTGTQYFCDAKQSKSIGDVFKAHAIPFYMLVNKNGDIMEASNNLRPGEVLTARKIDHLLE